MPCSPPRCDDEGRRILSIVPGVACKRDQSHISCATTIATINLSRSPSCAALCENIVHAQLDISPGSILGKGGGRIPAESRLTARAPFEAARQRVWEVLWEFARHRRPPRHQSGKCCCSWGAGTSSLLPSFPVPIQSLAIGRVLHRGHLHGKSVAGCGLGHGTLVWSPIQAGWAGQAAGSFALCHKESASQSNPPDRVRGKLLWLGNKILFFIKQRQRSCRQNR